MPANHTSNRTTRQSTRNVPPTPIQCHGCSQPMLTQFISNVLDHLWHPECVRCFTCRSLLNEKCYSREGKLYCKDDFIKKYIHRCFACQNLIQSSEFIRRIRPGRVYHAECFVCSKCKSVLKDDDISALIKSNDTMLNDLECICQICLNPQSVKSSNESVPLPNNSEVDKKIVKELTNGINGKTSPPLTANDVDEDKVKVEQQINDIKTVNNHVDEQQSMDVDESPMISKPTVINEKESIPEPIAIVSTPSVTASPTKTTGRQSKVRQSTSSNGSKRSPAKAKATTPVSRSKQTNGNERKGRSPATRSKTSGTSPASSVVQTRSSNRRTAKSARYRKRSFSSGSDEETEDEDDLDEDDTDYADEDQMQDEEQENARSPAVKTKPQINPNDKKPELESTPTNMSQPTLPGPPPATATNPSLLSQAKMSEPLSLLSGLAANPMSISSIMKPDLTPSFMPPNFNPAFPNPAQFLPPGFPLPPRLPMGPPPPTALPPVQPQPQPTAQTTESNRSPHSTNTSDSESLDRSSSPSHMDVSTNVEPGTPARPPSPKTTARQATPSTTTHKPSALSSLLEFGTVPPSTLGDIRPSNTSTNPFPFPFVTPGPGVPFSPQAAAGMTTFYRPPFGVAPSQPSVPLDMSQSNSNSSKKKSDSTDNDEGMSRSLLDDSSSSSPKKKQRKSNVRTKGKGKKNEVDGENGLDDDHKSPVPTQTMSTANKKKKKLKSDPAENGNTNDSDETKVTNGNMNNHSHNLLAQMGLLNNSFMPPPPLPPGATTNGKTPTPNAQQAQLAAMYNMAPHFAAYNAFPGAFNPAFAAAAYASGYPSPYGFHPAFGGPAPGQPFPFMPPPPSSLNNTTPTDDKSTPHGPSEVRSQKTGKTKSTNGVEKKKTPTSRTNKKKSAATLGTTDLPESMDGSLGAGGNSTNETISQAANTPESISTPTKRRLSGTESDDFDEHSHSQTTNGKSGYDSDGSLADADRSSSTLPSLAPEKKGARTTIKPQQLEILCKAYDSCSKPNKAQREQLVADTGLSLRVIQVWFQNRRSKERKGKPSKEKESILDDDEIGENSQPSPPPISTSESIPLVNTES